MGWTACSEWTLGSNEDVDGRTSKFRSIEVQHNHGKRHMHRACENAHIDVARLLLHTKQLSGLRHIVAAILI